MNLQLGWSWQIAAQSCSPPTPSNLGTLPLPAGTGGLGSPPSRSPPSWGSDRAGESAGHSSEPLLVFKGGGQQDSHSSQDFKGTNTVHEDLLLLVASAHEVPHVGADGPEFPGKVGLFIDHHLRTDRKSQEEVKPLKVLLGLTFGSLRFSTLGSPWQRRKQVRTLGFKLNNQYGLV